MIHEVDSAVLSLLRADALADDSIEIELAAPTKDWMAKRNAPTLNLFLYDIREDLRRRERGLQNQYDERGRIVARTLPPRYFVLSYLVTAWTARPEDEHRLLASVLGSLLRHDALPPESLTGGIAALGLPVPITVALPPPEDRAFADVWSALGGELRPSLDVRVVAPIEPARRYLAAPLVDKRQLSIHPNEA